MKRSILIITGTRAEYGYLRPLISEIKKSKNLSARLLVTGMHTLKKHGNTIQDIRRDAVPIDAIVPISESNTMIQSLSEEILGIERYCNEKRPDMILVMGDRDEPFAGAIVAGHLGIPLIHLAGGDSTGYVVDEPIRHSISKFAHVHFTWTKKTAARLRALGEESWRIHITGSTAFDDIRRTHVLNRKAVAKELGLDEHKSWILFVQHPTPLDPTPLMRQLLPSLQALANQEEQVVVILPNTDTGSGAFITEMESLGKKRSSRIFPSLPHVTYLSLLKHTAVIVGNSSSGVAEAGFFGTPAINIGNRQRGREQGDNVINVPYNSQKITTALRRALSPSFQKKARTARHPFDRGNASKRIVEILENLPNNVRLLNKQMP